MKFDLLLGPLLLIYQMPKTGSQTVEATLRECGFPRQVWRFHYLSKLQEAMLSEQLAGTAAEETWKTDVRDQLVLLRRMSRMLRRRRWLRRLGLPVQRIEVITGARELIGLALSSIFENRAFFAPCGQELTPEACRTELERPGMFSNLDHWFDLELKASTGVDIYRTPFPRKKGYTIVQNSFARVLVYRIEALENLPQMLHDFLGCRVRTVEDRNRSETKTYAGNYESVRSRLRLPPALVEARYRTRVMRYFYDHDELEVFRRQWSERPPRGEAGPHRAASPVGR